MTYSVLINARFSALGTLAPSVPIRYLFFALRMRLVETMALAIPRTNAKRESPGATAQR